VRWRVVLCKNIQEIQTYEATLLAPFNLPIIVISRKNKFRGNQGSSSRSSSMRWVTMLTEVRGASKKEAMGRVREKEFKNVGKRERERGEGEREKKRQRRDGGHVSCIIHARCLPRIFSCLNIWIPRSLQYWERGQESGLEKYSAAYSPRFSSGAGEVKLRIPRILPSRLFLSAIFFLSLTLGFERTSRNHPGPFAGVTCNGEGHCTRRIGDTRLRKAMKKPAGLSSASCRGALLIISTLIRNCSLFSE